MKGTIKKIINLAIVAVLCILSFGLFACEDLKHIEVKVSVYDIDNARLVEKTMKIDLYRHLAGDTVDAITEYINKGYYDGTVFYVNKNTTETGSAISIRAMVYVVLSEIYESSAARWFPTTGTALPIIRTERSPSTAQPW